MSETQVWSRVVAAARRARPSGARPGRFLSALDRLERNAGLDGLVETVQRRVHRLPLGDRGRDFLHGRWLGHPLHPLMVQVPLGSWLSAAVLDVMGGQRRAARTLVGVGLGAAAPAAIAGWTDWADLHKQQMRVGLVHAASNLTAVALYAGSLTARLSGAERTGRALGFAGLTVVGFGGLLGGHLAYRQASGANHAEEVPHLVGPGWHPLGEVAEFPVGEAVRRTVDAVPVMVVRESGGQVHVLAERCSHMAGPLSEGRIENGCVQCPWHGSVFRLADGWNVRGPATAPQPSFETRLVDGRVLARLRNGPDGAATAEQEPAGAGAGQ